MKPAEGESGRTIAQILEKPAKLGGKKVLVRGVVVKSTNDVLGKNWLHIRDGSAPGEGKDDLTVTTQDKATVGQTVLVEGTVAQTKTTGPATATRCWWRTHRSRYHLEPCVDSRGNAAGKGSGNSSLTQVPWPT